MDELALFAGAGGGILGGKLLGWRTRCAVEIDPYCREVLFARQADGSLPEFPVWDDIRTFDPSPWCGKIDVISGGFPCQDISAAGKGAGLAGGRSGLVFEMLSIINEIRPRFVFAENSPNLRTRGLGAILEALAGMGYDAKWGVLGAWHAGAPHRRNRMWIVATNTERAELRKQPRRCSGSQRQDPPVAGLHGKDGDVANPSKQYRPIDERETFKLGRRCQNVANTDSKRRHASEGTRCCKRSSKQGNNSAGGNWWETEPDVGRVAHGVAQKLDKS